MPSVLLAQTLHLSKFELTTTLIITYCLLFFSYIGAGLLGQAIGRRRTFNILGALIATVGVALLYTLANSAGRPLPEIILIVCALAILVTAPWGVIITYINERFVTEVRATGFGIGFSLSSSSRPFTLSISVASAMSSRLTPRRPHFSSLAASSPPSGQRWVRDEGRRFLGNSFGRRYLRRRAR